MLKNDDSAYMALSIRQKLKEEGGAGFPTSKVKPIHPLKRLFDVLASGSALLLLSPLLILIALLIKLESRGPVFYISKRIGRNYKPFDFYKFRSMRVDADKLIDEIKDQNAYTNEEADLSTEDYENGIALVGDEGFIDEGMYNFEEENGSSFIKVVNDPRITRVGKFIRNTSIDELPQLLNVLKGDMSLIGNRPLPLYEAEKLTSDEWVERFMAPSGITGLWQVTERGKADATEEGRMKLDIEYARKHSIWMDLRIIFKTLPAMFQQDNM